MKATEIIKMVKEEIKELDQDIAIQRVKMAFLQKLIERMEKCHTTTKISNIQ